MNDLSAIAMTISGAVEASGITRTRLYELIGAGALEARKCGRQTLITAESLRRYIAELPPAQIRAPKAATKNAA